MLIVASILGFCSAQIVRYLDSALSYGHKLGGIRLAIVRRVADRHGIDTVEMAINEEYEDFDSRADIMSQVYWSVAMKSHWLVLALCTWCMSFWVFCGSLGVAWVASTFLPVFDFEWYTWIAVGYIGFSVNTFFLALQK